MANVNISHQRSQSFSFNTTGHGTKLRDQDGDEDDGYDEALVPLDFQEGAGMIRDDDLYDTLIEPLAQGVHMVSLVRWNQDNESSIY